MTSLLLGNGANADQMRIDGSTALHLAVERLYSYPDGFGDTSELDSVRALCERMSRFDQRNNEGFTVLQQICYLLPVYRSHDQRLGTTFNIILAKVQRIVNQEKDGKSLVSQMLSAITALGFPVPLPKTLTSISRSLLQCQKAPRPQFQPPNQDDVDDLELAIVCGDENLLDHIIDAYKIHGVTKFSSLELALRYGASQCHFELLISKFSTPKVAQARNAAGDSLLHIACHSKNNVTW